MSTPIAVAAGINFRNNSWRFPPSATVKRLTPVMFPPGRARLAMRPNFTGSSPLVITIGIDAVAALAASAAGGEKAAITSTCRRTKSAANTGILS